MSLGEPRSKGDLESMTEAPVYWYEVGLLAEGKDSSLESWLEASSG
jgi:hypothetical protein